MGMVFLSEAVQLGGKYSGILIMNDATESAASDHASQKATRRLIPPTPRPCYLASSAITLLYSTAVSQTLRRDVPREYLPAPPTTRTWGDTEDVEGDTKVLINLSIDGEYSSDILSEPRECLLRAFATPSNG
jgi:hypothetical protein